MFKSFEHGINRWLTERVLKDIGLSTWNGAPAVFNGYAPNDKDSGWENGCFPRVVFNVDWNNEPNIKSAGMLYFDIFTSNESNLQPEEIADLIIPNISDVFFNTEKGVFSCAFVSSEGFSVDDKEGQVYFLELRFNVRAFPSQKTYLKPDPVIAVKEHLKAINNDFLILNLDDLPDVFMADTPVIYVRSLGLRNTGEDTFSFRFLDWTGVVHVICMDYDRMRKATGEIYQDLMMEGEIYIGENHGQLLLTPHHTNVEISYLSNQLIDGQMAFNTRFALVRQRCRHKLKEFSLTGDIHYENERRSKGSKKRDKRNPGKGED